MATKEELDDIFGVPLNGANVDVSLDSSDESQEGAYVSVMSSSEEVTFEQKAAILKSKMLESSPHKNETESFEEHKNEQRESEKEFKTIISDAKDAIKGSSEPESDAKVEEEQSCDTASDGPKESGNDVFDSGTVDIDASDDEGTMKESQDDVKIEEKSIEIGSIEQEDRIDEDAEDINVIHADLVNSGFIVKAPTRTYESFYSIKRSTLRRHLKNGSRLPIPTWNQEMHDAFVDIKVSFVDRPAIAQKMVEIQQKRDRIVQIKSVINSQYFFWKRLIPMMHGQLARVIYEKPAAKQEGVNYEHMRDMEEYFNELEGAYETSKDILNNLDAAYDNLSRQVTLSAPSLTPERQEVLVTERQEIVQKEIKPEIITTNISSDEFDGLNDISIVKDAKTKPIKTKENDGGPKLMDW